MKIKELRIGKGMTQEELAKKMEVERSTVAKWETGVAFPPGNKLPKLAEVLGCTIDDLYRKESAVKTNEKMAKRA